MSTRTVDADVPASTADGFGLGKFEAEKLSEAVDVGPLVVVFVVLGLEKAQAVKGCLTNCIRAGKEVLGMVGCLFVRMGSFDE